eukprot:4789651-Alexandrium_andersonii.AAC.1
MPRDGQQSAGCGVAAQSAAHAAAASRPPRPRAWATHAAPSVATSATAKQPLHHAIPAQSWDGVSHAAPTASPPQQQQLRGRCWRSAVARRTAVPVNPPPSSLATWATAVKSA